jgi:phosphoribosylformimino-5-aminoimidazole carboxamide ribotide isomerase
MTLFRPCIDLHDGKVKQIVGGTLRDEGAGPVENFVAEQPAAWFAERYRADGLTGGHVIKLGPGNEEAAREALAAWPGGMQLGGGVTVDTAAEWIGRGAAKVIVTSWLFVDKRLSMERVEQLALAIGPERLVVDLSCRRVPGGWRVATDRWQTITDTRRSTKTRSPRSRRCAASCWCTRPTWRAAARASTKSWCACWVTCAPCPARMPEEAATSRTSRAWPS